MKKYLTYFVTSFRAESTYKADFILSVAMNLIFFFIYIIIWKTIYASSGVSQIDSYTLSNTITYYFLANLIFRLDISNYIFLSWNIWSGNFTNDLIKPWNPKLVESVFSVADVFLNLILYIPVLIFMLIFTHQYIMVPSGFGLLYFIVFLILGLILNLIINIILCSLTFYFGDQDSLIGMINYLMAFLAGGFFPLAFLPGALQKVFSVLPFRFFFDVPVNVYLGKIQPDQIWGLIGQLILWILFFYIVLFYMFKGGLKRYTGTGR